MSNLDGVKSLFNRTFESAVVRLIVTIIFTLLAGLFLLLYEWEDTWWAVGMFLSLMTNVLLIQWTNAATMRVTLAKEFIRFLDEQLTNAKDNLVSKENQIEMLNKQAIKDREELDRMRSQLGESSTKTELKYVNMVVCDKGEFRRKPIVVVSLGHSDRDNFYYSTTSLLRFALEMHNAEKLCEMLAGIMRLSLKPSEEVEITEDDIPF